MHSPTGFYRWTLFRRQSGYQKQEIPAVTTEISLLPFYSADATTKLARALLFLQSIIDEFRTDIDLDTVKGVKQQSSEFSIKLIKVIDTLECSTQF